MLPFFLQWSLGGFEASSAVCLWGITSPLGALLFLGARQSIPWFAAFVGLVAFSAAIDPTLSESPADVPHGVVVAFFALNIIGVATTAYALLQYFVRARERALTALAQQHEALELEQAKSERLLLNVLPAPVAARLKERDEVIADRFDGGDGAVRRPGRLHAALRAAPAAELVALLDRIFSRFDALAARYGLEKIKTIGDAYMVVGGIPRRAPTTPRRSREMALEMQRRARALRRAAGLGCRCGSGSTPGRSSPA